MDLERFRWVECLEGRGGRVRAKGLPPAAFPVPLTSLVHVTD